MKKILLFLFSCIIITANNINAQDIIVKTNKSRIFTHVVNFTDNIIKCKGIDNYNDSIFLISTNEIEMILYEIGNIQYFNNNKSVGLTKQTTNDSLNNKDLGKIGYEYAKNKNESQKKSEKKVEENLLKEKLTIEIGSGITFGLFNKTYSSVYTPYQVNARVLNPVSEKSKNVIGVNLNYSNLATVAVARRLSLHGIVQNTLYQTKYSKVYFNLMLGIAKFSSYNTFGNNYFGNGTMLSGHMGLGYKYYFDYSKVGYFIEGGIGGPYFLNIGILFY
jgi:hypothetical protein